MQCSSPRCSCLLPPVVPRFALKFAHSSCSTATVKGPALPPEKNEACFLAAMLLHDFICRQRISVFLLVPLICSYFGAQPSNMFHLHLSSVLCHVLLGAASHRCGEAEPLAALPPSSPPAHAGLYDADFH